MSRALVLGNGQVLVNLDASGQVRDFYFPHVGLENQLGGRYVHRIGVFLDGRLSWISDADWQISLNYEKGTFASEIVATAQHLGVSLRFHDVVYNEKNIFVRRVVIKNLANRERAIKIFFAQQFELYESYMAHTAYFDPGHHAIVHYRNQRAFVVNGRLAGRDFDDYSTGVFGMEGKEGTHLDAVDGALSQNPIEHGQADSVLGWTASYQTGEEKHLYYWLTVAQSINEALALNQYVLENGPGHLLDTTRDFWRAWVGRQDFHFRDLAPEIVSLFQKSLFLIRAHADQAGGIIASSDSAMMQHGKDTYNYVWPRDASIAALALARAGDAPTARRFFAFANEVLHDGEYFMHKYSPDKSLGSSWHPWVRAGKPELPIQEDETALVLIALWQYYQVTKDIEFVEEIYNSLIKRTADFLVVYRDEASRLPHPSYNLWEEKFGVSVYTASAVSAALSAAGHFAELLGKMKSARLYEKAAVEIRAAIMSQLYDEEKGVCRTGPIDAADAYGLFAFEVIAAGDERLRRLMAHTDEVLRLKTSVGGWARYENDHYYRVSENTPGNPWFITTLWFAQYQIKMAATESELAPVRETLSWVARRATPAGLLPEQLNPHSGEPISATPLVWSHAEFVNTVIQYLDKLAELGR